MHAAWWNAAQLGAALGLRDEGWYERRGRSVQDLFARLLEEVGRILSPRARGALEAVAGFHPTLLEREANGNVTVAYGEALCWSFLHPRDPAVGRPCLIDWEAWDIEPGTNDLAALIAVRCYPDLREYLERPLLERYHRRL